MERRGKSSPALRRRTRAVNPIRSNTVCGSRKAGLPGPFPRVAHGNQPMERRGNASSQIDECSLEKGTEPGLQTRSILINMNDFQQSLKNKLILAPMAGFSDRPFRRLCIEQGADYVVTEMVSAKALCFGDKKTAPLAAVYQDEMPAAVQIFGSEPELMARAAYMLSNGLYEGCLSDTLPAAIDINMGCPVHKIVSNGEGSALMRDEQKVYEIVSAVKKSSAAPVTVKIRAGFDSEHKNAVRIAQIIEEAGADAVCVHGRTRDRMYAPGVDLDVIRDVKKALSIPVVGNGDIFSAEDAVRMKDYTNCDALMIARSALGDPFIFARIRAAIDGKPYDDPPAFVRVQTAKRHLRMMLDLYGEERGLREARKHIALYIKGVKGAAAMRDRINRTEDANLLFTLLDECAAQCR